MYGLLNGQQLFIDSILRVDHISGLIGRPLQIFFNVKDVHDEYSSFSIGINNDGESISFVEFQNKLNVDEVYKNIYYGDASLVDLEDELFKLVGQQITNIQFGNGKANILIDGRMEHQEVVYYFKLNTTKYNLLFFNNGDEGEYVFDNIDEVLKNDIFGFLWSSLPANFKEI